jgi:hypothetical protein
MIHPRWIAITGVHHGALIRAYNKMRAASVFRLKYPSEKIIDIRYTTQP